MNSGKADDEMHERRRAELVLAVVALLAGLFTLSRLPAMELTGEPEEVEPAETEAVAVLATEPEIIAIETETPQIDWSAAEAMAGECVFVYDCTQEQMLYCSTDSRECIYPASITKLFSAWVALQYLQPEQTVQAGRELGLLQPGSSTAYIAYGSILTVEMLVEGMLLPSGNDAAYILAAAAGRELLGESQAGAALAVEAFVEEMNRQAEEQGLTGTHFENPDGYHADSHYSCPRDLAVMGKLALEDPVIARYVRCRSDAVRFASGETCTWNNSNRLLNPNSQYYCSSAIGLKTGHTTQAGYCLLAAFETDAGDILVGIFGATDSLSRYSDAVALMELATAAQPNSF